MEPLKNSHDQSSRLTLTYPAYRDAISRLVFCAEEDISSIAVIPQEAVGVAQITAHEDGILAGVPESLFLFKSVPEKLQARAFLADGDRISAGDVIFDLTGNVRAILKLERTAVNILARMSGIATGTRRLADLAGGVLLCSTRKTLWGLLDKRAVAVGGGGTHRLDAGDAILLKDNHLAYFGGDITAMMEKFESYVDSHGAVGQFVEVEVDSVADAEKALAILGHIQHLHSPLAILLDNMPVRDVETVVLMRKDHGLDRTVALEASGGITEGNLREYAQTGVDIISMGSLTMDASSLDFSLRLTM